MHGYAKPTCNPLQLDHVSFNSAIGHMALQDTGL